RDDGGRVVGFVDDNPDLRRRRIQGIAVLGSIAEVEDALRESQADEVVISIPNSPADRLDRVERAAASAGVPCKVVRRRTETLSVAHPQPEPNGTA
ncbi:MAG: hypothetical protein FJW96_12225, partial [Actinobacteria bacterium]|nr:hypothetical protein [Actinomycetota bacterium]